jgi:hypothetical protein
LLDGTVNKEIAQVQISLLLDGSFFKGVDESEGFIIGPEDSFLLFDSFLVDGVDESQRLGKSLCGLGH